MGFRNFHRNIKIRILVALLFGTAQSTSVPFMAIYFAKNVGEVITGVLLTIGILGTIAGGIVGGYYCDRIGRRKIMIFGEAVFLTSYLVMALANSPWWHSAWTTFAVFSIGNVCWGAYGPADEAMMLDLTTPEQRPAVYGMFYWLFNLTMAVGASIGAFMFEDHRFLLFTLTSVVLLFVLLTTVFWIKETYHPSRAHEHGTDAEHKPSMFRAYRTVFTDHTFIKYLVGCILMSSLEFQLNNYIGIHLAKHMLTRTYELIRHASITLDGLKMVGFLQTENTILVVLLAALAARFAVTRHRGSILLFGLVFNVVGFVLMTILTAPVALIAAMLVATIGEVVNVPIRQSFVGDMAPEHLRSSYVAVNGMTFSAARMLASLAVVLGAAVPTWSMTAITAIVGATGVFLISRVSARLHPTPRAETSQLSV